MTWRSRVSVRARPAHVLAVLTDPAACARWSPVDFAVRDLESDRLASGSSAKVTGRLFGWPMRFTVHVLEVAADRLRLRAVGPVEMNVDYLVRPTGRGSAVHAAISIGSRDGYRGAVTARLTGLLLGNGTLDGALRRIAGEAERLESMGVTAQTAGRRS